MRDRPWLAAARWGTLLFLVPFLAGGICSGSTGIETPLSYTLEWLFENDGCDSASFTGTDVGGSQGVSTRLGPGDRDTLRTSAPYERALVGVTATANAGVLVGDAKNVEVAMGMTTRLTVRFTSGTVHIYDAYPAFMAVSSPACAPPTWTLAGITGATTGSWSDQYGSASGSIALNVPQTVIEGSTVSVSTTFTATVTEAPGWARRVDLSAGLVDRGIPGLQVSNIANLGTANLTVSGSVTASGNWVIPTNPAVLKLEAGGNVLQGGPPGSQLNLVATYVKSP